MADDGVARLALDALRSARSRRERYVGPWLPEPLLAADAHDPADRVTLDESVSYALLAVLEQLPPAERTAFVLHDVFDVPFPEVAEVVGRTPDAVRQLASRARRHVAEQRPRQPVSDAEHRRVVEAFARAAAKATSRACSRCSTRTSSSPPTAAGSRSRPAARCSARRAWQGVDRHHAPPGRRPARARDPQRPRRAARRRPGRAGRTALAFTVDGGRIVRIDVMRNPRKLRRAAV